MPTEPMTGPTPAVTTEPAVKTKAESAIDDAVASARNMRDEAAGVAENFQTAVDSSLRGQPITTLALAGVVGFILGAIWKA